MALNDAALSMMPKNAAWHREMAIRMRDDMVMGSNGRGHKMMQECYNIYYGEQDEADFEYLTGKGNYRMPARVRSIPMLRPFWDILSATFLSRPIETNVYAIDNDNLSTKKDLLAKQLVDDYIRELRGRQMRAQAIAERAQAAESSMGMQNGSSGMSQQASMLMEEINRSNDLLENQLEKLQTDAGMDFATQSERHIADGLRYLVQTQGLKDVFAEGFRDLYVVDNAIFTVDSAEEGADPTLRRVSPLEFYYQAGDGVRHLRDCERIVERQWLTLSQVIERYGDDMSAQEISDLKSVFSGIRYQAMALYDYDDPSSLYGGAGCDRLYDGSVSGDGMIEVINCSWFAPRKITFVEHPNKYDPSLPYVRLASDDDEAKKMLRKRSKIRHRYVRDLHQCVLINGTISVKSGMAPMQFRDACGNAHQPYSGYAYNSTDNKPYSRVWAVRSIHILYQLAYYQTEMLITMSGLRGFIVDMAQLPKNWTLEKLLYYAKQGIVPVDSTMPNLENSRRHTGFNQFTSYDQTFGNSLVQITQFLDRLDHLAGRVIGIPPQRLGEVSASDGLGTNRQAIAQSNLTTEVLFHKMNTVISQSLNMLIHMLPHCWKNGKRGQFVLGGKGQQMLEIAAGELEDGQYECYIQEAGKDQRIMDQALALITQNFQGTGMPLSQLITMFNASSLRELDGLLRKYEELAMKRQSEGAQNQQQHEQELQRLDAEAKAMSARIQEQTSQIAAQVDTRGQDIDMQRAQLEAQTKLQIEQMKDKTTRYRTDQETAMEAANLQQIARSSNVDARLRATELMMDATERGTLSSPARKEQPR